MHSVCSDHSILRLKTQELPLVTNKDDSTNKQMYQNLCTTKFRLMVLIEINLYKTTEVKLNEEMKLAY